jgi:hypothetical protein
MRDKALSPSSSSREKRTSEVLEHIRSQLGEGQTTLARFLDFLDDRGFGLGILLFALPNVPPLGIPGISSVCGTVIFLFAFQLLMGKPELSLPKAIAQKPFSAPLFSRVLGKCLPPMRWLEKLVKPRWPAFASKNAERVTALFFMMHAAVIFLPIPFGNFLPAWCMCLLALAVLERDGLLMVIGWVTSVGVIGGMSFGIWKALTLAFHAVASWFSGLGWF